MDDADERTTDPWYISLPVDMDLEELRAFLTVVDTGSFLAAADSLGVSRTTLRRRVGSLEARAGVTLLESTSQGAVLTEAGQLLAKGARGMVEEARALVASVREVGREPSGVLRMVLPVGLPPHLLMPIFGMLRAAWPRLSVHARFSNDPVSDPLVDTDLVVHFSEEGPKGPWISYVVTRPRAWLLASKEYLAKRGTPTGIDDLHNHELFSWQAPGADAYVWPLWDGGSFAVDPALVASDIHMIRTLCLGGLGIGLLPDAMVADPGYPDGTLVRVLPELVGREHVLRLTVPSALAEVPKIKAVLAQIRNVVGEP